MALFTKFYRCIQGFHSTCAVELGDETTRLHLKCNCECHKKKDELSNDQDGQSLENEAILCANN